MSQGRGRGQGEELTPRCAGPCTGPWQDSSHLLGGVGRSIRVKTRASPQGILRICGVMSKYLCIKMEHFILNYC